MVQRRKFRNILSHISSFELIQPDNDNQMTNKELYLDLTASRGTSLFLGQYSSKGILFILQGLGILSRLEKFGLDSISVEISTSQPFKHLLRLTHHWQEKKLVIAELAVREGTFGLDDSSGKEEKQLSYSILMVEWLLIQNPLGHFSRAKPQLPGQQFPGLGMAGEVCEILYWMARRRNSDGVMIVPDSLHAAVIYSVEFRFADPRTAAMLKRIQKQLIRRRGLAQTAWACQEGRIINTVLGETFVWRPAEMIIPASRRMRDFFHSKQYKTKFRRHLADYDFETEQGFQKNFSPEWKAVS
jgi:hypothetical protein